MKRLTWMTLIIGMLMLTACGAPRTEPVNVLPTDIPATATQPVTVYETAAPTSTPEIVIPVSGAEATPTQPAVSGPVASVSADGLNLRVGPGLNYRIIAVLPEGAQVDLAGRSQDGDWINIRTAGGQDGWVFSAYLKSPSAFTGLPVLESYGGPEVEQPAEESPIPARYRMDMTISNNTAEVALAGFPANTDLYLRLAVRGGGPSMTVASGRTGANGTALFTFDMPVTWPDGSAVTQTELLLTAADTAGRLDRSINIYYDAGY